LVVAAGVELEDFVVLTGAGLDVDGVALTETLTEAGLDGAAVLDGARVDSEVSAPDRE
jgi:hypothetical protein